jgi:hypothetical protein
MKYEIGSFLIWHTAIRIIRVFPRLKVDYQPLIFWSVLVLDQGIAQGFGSDEEREATMSGRM